MCFASLFSGKMLGDGSINRNHKSYRFCFLHKLADKSYAEYCYQLFSPYLPFGSRCKHIDGIFDKRTEKTYYRIYYQSLTSPIINWLHTVWYREGRKVVPVDWIYDNFNSETLSIWYQDDGCLKGSGQRIILSTESFSNEEINFLQQLLRDKFNIFANIDIQNRLDISSRLEVQKFLALVEPFIHPSMERKSMTEIWRDWQKGWPLCKVEQCGVMRTSIYLPYGLFQCIGVQNYSPMLNNLLDEWLDKQWYENIIEPNKRYNWLLSHENTEKGSYLLTPRFRPGVRKRLDLLTKATGFEMSELVSMALRNSRT